VGDKRSSSEHARESGSLATDSDSSTSFRQKHLTNSCVKRRVGMGLLARGRKKPATNADPPASGRRDENSAPKSGGQIGKAVTHWSTTRRVAARGTQVAGEVSRRLRADGPMATAVSLGAVLCILSGFDAGLMPATSMANAFCSGMLAIDFGRMGRGVGASGPTVIPYRRGCRPRRTRKPRHNARTALWGRCGRGDGVPGCWPSLVRCWRLTASMTSSRLAEVAVDRRRVDACSARHVLSGHAAQRRFS